MADEVQESTDGHLPAEPVAFGRRRLVALAIAAVAGAAVLGAAWAAGWTDPGEVEAFLTESGAWGPLVFVLVMWMVQPFGVPGTVFMVPAALVWPWPTAVGLSWIGNMGASTIAFAFARWVAHDWAQARIPPRIAAYNARLARGGTREVTVLRVITGQLPPADWLLGVSPVGWRPFLVGTGLGIVPGIVLMVVVGAGVVEWVLAEPIWLVALLPAGLALLIARRMARARRA